MKPKRSERQEGRQKNKNIMKSLIEKLGTAKALLKIPSKNNRNESTRKKNVRTKNNTNAPSLGIKALASELGKKAAMSTTTNTSTKIRSFIGDHVSKQPIWDMRSIRIPPMNNRSQEAAWTGVGTLLQSK